MLWGSKTWIRGDELKLLMTNTSKIAVVPLTHRWNELNPNLLMDASRYALRVWWIMTAWIIMEETEAAQTHSSQGPRKLNTCKRLWSIKWSFPTLVTMWFPQQSHDAKLRGLNLEHEVSSWNISSKEIFWSSVHFYPTKMYPSLNHLSLNPFWQHTVANEVVMLWWKDADKSSQIGKLQP